MARFARIVVPDIPHHVTQRGNRKQRTFFKMEDYKFYLFLLKRYCRLYDVEIWAYCLMTNHVHLILLPHAPDTLGHALSHIHREYTRVINLREGWRGYLWQGRFASFPMDERHLLTAARYVELNPVRAGLVADPAAYPWSSAVAHLRGQDDEIVTVAPLLSRIAGWRDFLRQAENETERSLLHRHIHTGRPLGDEVFISKLEQLTGRILRKKKSGPKPPS